MEFKRIIPAIFMPAVFILMLLLILYPDRYVNASAEGLKLFATSVLPSLLPFMFITAILTRTGSAAKLSRALSPVTKALFNAKGISAYVYIMSVFSGYPVGSKIIADLYESKKISSQEATKMSTFCSTSGPLFIIGSVGAGMFADKKIGFLLYIVHIVAGLICGILFRGYGQNQQSQPLLLDKKIPDDNVLGEAMLSSVTTIICVGGFITVFYILADMLFDFKILYPIEIILRVFFKGNQDLASYFSQGLIEVTRGCQLLGSLPGKVVLPSVSFIIAFGGLSIIIQQIVFLKKAKADIGVFLFSKLLHAVIAFALCFLLLSV